MQFYSNPEREADLHSLPDCEVIAITGGIEWADWLADHGPGIYYWFCQPGCLPDSDPIGPFNSQELAIADARESI